MNRKVFWNAKGEKTIQECKPAGHCQSAQRSLMTVRAIIGTVLLIGVMVAPLYAQSYPNKPIRLIMPFTTGGATDLLGRIIAKKLSDRLGQPVVPENRPGAGGNIGSALAAKAQPDGYTILQCSSMIAISPNLYKYLVGFHRLRSAA